jgi:N-acetylglutamate synthase-like GNAT family acetyltransferase
MAATMEIQEVSEVTVRDYRSGDDNAFYELLSNSFGRLEFLPRVKAEMSGPYFNRQGSFVAEKNGSVLGCVGLLNFPRGGWFDIRYLAVRDFESRSQIAQKLVAKAEQHADSCDCEMLKAFVPAVQPFVDVYKQSGFEPVRRSLRMVGT